MFIQIDKLNRLPDFLAFLAALREIFRYASANYRGNKEIFNCGLKVCDSADLFKKSRKCL
jgi:hypothetical protein